jgi:FkbM family methyltransferase
MTFYFFKTLREKKFVVRALKAGNLLPLLQYIIFRLRLSHLFSVTRRHYTIQISYSPYAFWLWTHKDREKDEELFFEKFLKEGDIVVDCGAHLGTLTLTAASLVKEHGHVYAYEANPRTCSYLQQNILRNNHNNITTKNVAVGDKEGVVHIEDLYVSDVNSIKETGVVVTVETLQSLSHLPRIDLLKLDIEGYELMALRGAGNVLDITQAIYFEIKETACVRYGYSGRDIILFLENERYDVYLTKEGEIRGRVLASFVPTMKHHNFLAIKRTSSTER